MKRFETLEEFVAAREQFFKGHPDAPEASGVKCLNLIMKREYAEQILAGTKKLEFREYKEHYIKQLIDPAVADYISKHPDDDDVMYFCNDIRQVESIHFHNYQKNGWYLDVECTFNDAFCVNEQGIQMLHDKYNCHDFDDDLQQLNAMGVPPEERPWIFYFECGKVLATNLR